MRFSLAVRTANVIFSTRLGLMGSYVCVAGLTIAGVESGFPDLFLGWIIE